MRIGFENPWVELMLEQAWIVRQMSETAAKCIDTDLLFDALALRDYGLHPSAERLNPLEFHGKRRAPTPRRSPSSDPERRAQAPPRKESGAS